MTTASFRGEKAFLSNFYDAPLTYKGITYQSAEVAYQAQKCGTEAEKRRFSALSSAEAKKLSHSMKIRPTWGNEKVAIMTEIVRAKFEQNPELAEKLRATGCEELEEINSWGDTFWGMNENGEGDNMLGKILMQIRDELNGNLPEPEEKPAPKRMWGKKADVKPDGEIKLEPLTEKGIISEEKLEEMKNTVRKAVSMNKAVPITKLAPAEYKYLNEYAKVQRLKNAGNIKEEEAENRERKLRQDYIENKADEKQYIDNIKYWQESIRQAEMNLSAMHKTDSKDEALDLALQTLQLLTKDTTIHSVLHKKFFG